MAEIFVISDTHFQHANFLNFKDSNGEFIRKFKDVTEMDELIVERWNKVVTPQDKIYHCGDVYFGNSKSADVILSRLNGKKRLILGNHDNGKSTTLHKHFQKIELWRMFPEFGLLLTHIPVHPSNLKILVSERHDLEEGACGKEQIQMYNIHGHIHQNPSPEGPYRNVCVEHTNYAPVNIEDLRVRTD